eukprot:CAMPEP_0119260424 /NCGR_PEP_ID=MMETSP1329-20130426/814_1 /TAXON_ID=114041 /ORGANISM="Genus nov. species nov., Strain RCC1024" /LENGTH=450 /DNA_ID=CAMNT_0007259847 /DNA_START=181 /DNA_END=1533 /DNA_ORIENTATION=+
MMRAARLARRACAAPPVGSCSRAWRSMAAGAKALYDPKPLGPASAAAVEKEARVGAENYAPLPVVLARGEGAKVWDADGAEYLDFLSAYSAVNQGHCHPKIVRALADQAGTLGLTSRAFYNDVLGEYCAFMTQLFGYERLLPMNSGVEGSETAVKLSRRWAYDVKGVAPGEAVVIMAYNNFWGRSIAALSSSSDPDCRRGFGPYAPGFDLVDYGDAAALEAKLEEHAGKVAAVMLEPIQGEAGVVVPPDPYLPAVKALCEAHNCLFVADEVQTGIGRTGKLLAVDHVGVRPDVLVLGKALSGGAYPVSAVLADSDIMLNVRPGEHGSTYGGNPVAAKVAMAALGALLDEGMVENAEKMGAVLDAALQNLVATRRIALGTRGRGLLRALIIDDAENPGALAYDVCLAMRDRGVLAKPTHGNIIRLAPPLVIDEAQMGTAVAALDGALALFD